MADKFCHRIEASRLSSDGIALLARAFNYCDNAETPWRYAREVQDRFIELASEIVALTERGAIESNPAHARLQAARSDHAVARLIADSLAAAGE
jgi:hypothetical protein